MKYGSDEFTDRIIFLDGFPNMQVLDPLRSVRMSSKSSRQIWRSNTMPARAIRRRRPIAIPSATASSEKVLFEDLMKDEEHHIDFLETQVDLITALGLQLYSSTHVGKPQSD